MADTILEAEHYNLVTRETAPGFYRPVTRDGFNWVPNRIQKIEGIYRLLRGYWMPTEERIEQAHQEGKAWVRGQYTLKGKWVDGYWTTRRTLPPDIFESKEFTAIKKILVIVEENKETLARIETRLGALEKALSVE